MAEWIGALGSVGMLALIAGLALAFLREIGLLAAEGQRSIIKTAATTGAVGCAYILLGALIRQVLHGDVDSVAHIHHFFTGDYLRACFAALEGPSWPGMLSGMFAVVAHGMGKLLFQQYMLAGMALAYCMDVVSAYLMYLGTKKFWRSEAMVQDAVFLFFCLPGSVFFFLPCGAPVGLLIFAVIVFLVSKKLPNLHLSCPQGLYGWLLAGSGMLSAMVVCGLADGQIG